MKKNLTEKEKQLKQVENANEAIVEALEENKKNNIQQMRNL